MKNFSSILIIVALFHYSVQAQPKSSKRGIASNITSIADLKILSPGISWYYNWAQTPSSSVKGYLATENVQFVPMIWNDTQSSIDAANLYYPTDPTNGYLLGFNEPNFPDQANMTPAEAAAFWPKLEQLASNYNLKLVAPVTNYSAGIYDPKYAKIMYQDPYSYLDEFFLDCPSCKVDYIAVHWYGYGGLETVVNEMWNRYHKPIWVTEFSAWGDDVGASMSLQLEKDFMIKYVELLENNPNVFRYSWFTGRASNNDFIDLLVTGSSGKLTDLGNLYLNMPVHDPSYFQTIPARIQAENYTLMSGIQIQATSDIDGYIQVAYIDANDYMEYNIDVPENISYPLRIRYSATKNTQISINEGLTEITAINLSNTNSYNTWQTIETTINLSAGQHTLRLIANNSGFNLNWIQFGDVAIGMAEIPKENLDLKIQNNPIKDGFIIISSQSKIKKDLSTKIEILDIAGKILISKNIQPNTNNEYILNINELGKFNSGIYLLRLTTNDGYFSEKFVVEDN